MHGLAHCFGRVAPATSAVVPLLWTEPQKRRVLRGMLTICADTSPKVLSPRIDEVYKNWGRGGFHKKYEIQTEIGQGAYGTVYRARGRGTQIYRAVKEIDKIKIHVDDLKNEINALLDLDHPHIVKLIRYYDEEAHFYLVFELCTGPDLFDAIAESMESSQGRMTEYDASVALRHMLKALKCCHNHFMGHYDIKPENFMYRSANCYNLKMIDLGMSSGFSLKSKSVRGTSEYMAPEIYRRLYGPEADVWSCGVVLFMMLTGSEFYPSKDAEEMARLVNDRQWLSERVKWASDQGISSEAHSLLKSMLRIDRFMRITVAEALKHPFVLNNITAKPLHDTKLRSEARAVLNRFQDNLRSFSKLPMLTRATLVLTAHFVTNNQEPGAPCRLAFRKLDMRGNGELSVDALQEALEAHNVHVGEDIGDLFKIVDFDNNGYLSYVEFLSVTLPSCVFTDNVNFHESFNFFDGNGDGFIDAGDLAEALGYKTDAEIEICRDAMREVCPAPYCLSRSEFLRLVKSSDQVFSAGLGP